MRIFLRCRCGLRSEIPAIRAYTHDPSSSYSSKIIECGIAHVIERRDSGKKSVEGEESLFSGKTQKLNFHRPAFHRHLTT